MSPLEVPSTKAPGGLFHMLSALKLFYRFPFFLFSYRVFVLIHKMDLVPEENRERIFHNRKQVINDASAGTHCTFFMTSIWDETLYKVRCKYKDQRN